MTKQGSIVGATTAVKTVSIPDRGKKVYYRGFLIHGEVPGLCYVIYGNNELGQLAELGAADGFFAAMRWVDRHMGEMAKLMPVPPAEPEYTDTDELRAAA